MATRPVPSSPSKGPSNETELPTYEQSNATNLDSIPATEASPAEVREFLKRLLIAKRPNVDSDQVSAKWVNGSGKELRTYPPSMFFEIFGREDGWMVYKELKLFMYVCERNDKSKEPTTEAKCKQTPPRCNAIIRSTLIVARWRHCVPIGRRSLAHLGPHSPVAKPSEICFLADRDLDCSRRVHRWAHHRPSCNYRVVVLCDGEER